MKLREELWREHVFSCGRISDFTPVEEEDEVDAGEGIAEDVAEEENEAGINVAAQ